MSSTLNTDNVKFGMLITAPSPVFGAALTYGFVSVFHNGWRKSEPKPLGCGPSALYVRVPGSTDFGTMKLVTR